MRKQDSKALMMLPMLRSHTHQGRIVHVGTVLVLVICLLAGTAYAARPVVSDSSSSKSLSANSASEGQTLYAERCLTCHGNASTGAPTEKSLRALSAAQIESAMTNGVMRIQSTGLSRDQITAIANYLAPTTPGQLTTSGYSKIDEPIDNWCEGELSLTQAPVWNRWGNGLRNQRRQAAAKSDISLTNVSALKLKWAFAFPGAVRARSQPAVTPEAIYTGSQNGTVYALNPETGCVWWTFKADAEVRSAITIETDQNGVPAVLYFGDFEANVYSVRADDGALIWKRDVRDHPNGTITGSPTLWNGKLFVPMSSLEVISAYSDDYECCHFRGGILALDSTTGKQVWRMYTVAPPEKQGVNSAGIEMWGPSGAPIWSTPTVDAKRDLLYVGTGENYSSPANHKSDAIIAINIKDGSVRWVRQTIANDAWNGACTANVDKINCPEEDGPDFDFGAPPILTTVEGRDVILAGQKSGMVFALDPSKEGEIMWQRRAGMGGFNGGIHWGMSVDGTRLFVPIADTPGHDQTTGDPQPGLHAFDILSGEPLWRTLHPAKCAGERSCYFEGLSAAVTTASGMVFAGALNGRLAAYSQTTGEILWRTETNIPFKAINGVEAHGGSIDSAGPVVAKDLLIVNSGYDKWGQIPGNVLLVFELTEPVD